MDVTVQQGDCPCERKITIITIRTHEPERWLMLDKSGKLYAIAEDGSLQLVGIGLQVGFKSED